MYILSNFPYFNSLEGHLLKKIHWIKGMLNQSINQSSIEFHKVCAIPKLIPVLIKIVARFLFNAMDLFAV
jgi:hypothetical protein